MDFEFIDENEIEYSSNVRTKKTPSLYDSNITDRTYWGNDAGTELAMALARIEIRKSLRNMELIDVDDHDLTRVLLKTYRDELRIYQAEMIKVLFPEDNIIVYHIGYGHWSLQIQ